MKDFFKCLAIIIGTIIGAGFASGREILDFFNAFEEKGLYGIFISSILFGAITIFMIFIIKKRNIIEYKKLVNDNKFLSFAVKIFSFICFCIMISGVGAFCEEQLNINFWYGLAIASLICYIMFLNKFKGIEVLSCILVPLIIIGILSLGISNYDGMELFVNYEKNNEIKNYTSNWLISSILYTSYNSLILIPILINLKNYNLDNKKIYGLGLGVFIILGMLMFLIYRSNMFFYPNIMAVELPNMMLATLLSGRIKYAYAIVMLAAIFTTAFSCGYSFLNMCEKNNYRRNALVMCILACLCARIGFSNMINICFPIFGYLGIFQIILVFIKLKNGEGNR